MRSITAGSNGGELMFHVEHSIPLPELSDLPQISQIQYCMFDMQQTVHRQPLSPAL
jgi:hypothetical protein